MHLDCRRYLVALRIDVQGLKYMQFKAISITFGEVEQTLWLNIFSKKQKCQEGLRSRFELWLIQATVTQEKFAPHLMPSESLPDPIQVDFVDKGHEKYCYTLSA